MSDIKAGDIAALAGRNFSDSTSVPARKNLLGKGSRPPDAAKECQSAFIPQAVPGITADISTLAKAIPEGRASRIFWSRDLPCFGVRVTRTCTSFVVCYRVRGRKRLVTLGRFPELKPAAAILAARKHIPARGSSRGRRLWSMAILGKEYLQRHARMYKRASSVEGDAQMLEGIILPRIGRLAVADVDRRDIENLQQSVRHTPIQANRILALLSKMFSLSILWGWRNWNPVHGIPRFLEQKRERWLRPEELARLLKVLDRTEKTSEARAGVQAVRLILLTGCRKGELLAARWEDFDLKRRVWTKPAHSTKQKRVAHVPLNRPAARLLSSMLKTETAGLRYSDPMPWQSGQPLFPKLNARKLREIWGQIRRQAKIADVRIHDLRHTFASILVSAGEPLLAVGKLLGHTQAKTTERYAHLADQVERRTSERFGRVYSAAGQGRHGGGKL